MLLRGGANSHPACGFNPGPHPADSGIRINSRWRVFCFKRCEVVSQRICLVVSRHVCRRSQRNLARTCRETSACCCFLAGRRHLGPKHAFDLQKVVKSSCTESRQGSQKVGYLVKMLFRFKDRLFVGPSRQFLVISLVAALVRLNWRFHAHDSCSIDGLRCACRLR